MSYRRALGAHGGPDLHPVPVEDPRDLRHRLDTPPVLTAPGSPSWTDWLQGSWYGLPRWLAVGVGGLVAASVLFGRRR